MKKIILILTIVIAMLMMSGCTVPNILKPAASMAPSAQPTTGPTQIPTAVPAASASAVASPTATATATAPVTGASFAGTWDTDWGNMTLAVNGNAVNGTYDFQGGLINGTVSGKNLTGTWSEDPTHLPPNDAGDVLLTMSDDGSTMSGSWRYGHSNDPNAAWSGSWEGSRVR